MHTTVLCYLTFKCTEIIHINDFLVITGGRVDAIRCAGIQVDTGRISRLSGHDGLVHPSPDIELESLSECLSLPWPHDVNNFA